MRKVRLLPELVAPCGIDCGLCIAFFGYTAKGEKRKQACSGCRLRRSPCAFIKKGCAQLATKKIDYCFECADFPCARLTRLDRRYRRNYGMSPIENLRSIQANGVRQFLKNEKERWKCPNCGGVICVHNKKCYNCNPVS